MGSGSSIPATELSRLSTDGEYGPKIKDIFYLLDKDHSGSIDLEELCVYLKREEEITVEDNGQNISRLEERATLHFEELDLDSDGVITLEEFCTAIDSAIYAQRKKRLKKGEKSNHRNLRTEIDHAFSILDAGARETSQAIAQSDAEIYIQRLERNISQQLQTTKKARIQANADALPPPLCVERWASGFHGSLLRNQRFKDMHVAMNWLQSVLPLASFSAEISSTIKSLFANPDFTLNLSRNYELLCEVQENVAQYIRDTMIAFIAKDLVQIEKATEIIGPGTGFCGGVSSLFAPIPESEMSCLTQAEVYDEILMHKDGLKRLPKRPAIPMSDMQHNLQNQNGRIQEIQVTHVDTELDRIAEKSCSGNNNGNNDDNNNNAHHTDDVEHITASTVEKDKPIDTDSVGENNRTNKLISNQNSDNSNDDNSNGDTNDEDEEISETKKLSLGLSNAKITSKNSDVTQAVKDEEHPTHTRRLSNNDIVINSYTVHQKTLNSLLQLRFENDEKDKQEVQEQSDEQKSESKQRFKIGGILSRLVDNKNENDDADEITHTLSEVLNSQNATERAHTRAHIVRIIVEAVRVDIEQRLVACASRVAESLLTTRRTDAANKLKPNQRSNSAALLLLEHDVATNPESLVNASEGPSTVSSEVKEFPEIVQLTSSLTSSKPKVNQGATEQNDDVEYENNDAAQSRGMENNCINLSADFLRFNITTGSPAHLQLFMTEAVRAFGGALDVVSTFSATSRAEYDVNVDDLPTTSLDDTLLSQQQTQQHLLPQERPDSEIMQTSSEATAEKDENKGDESKNSDLRAPNESKEGDKSKESEFEAPDCHNRVKPVTRPQKIEHDNHQTNSENRNKKAVASTKHGFSIKDLSVSIPNTIDQSVQEHKDSALNSTTFAAIPSNNKGSRIVAVEEAIQTALSAARVGVPEVRIQLCFAYPGGRQNLNNLEDKVEDLAEQKQREKQQVDEKSNFNNETEEKPKQAHDNDEENGKKSNVEDGFVASEPNAVKKDKNTNTNGRTSSFDVNDQKQNSENNSNQTKSNAKNDSNKDLTSAKVVTPLELLKRPHMQSFLRQYYSCGGYQHASGKSLTHEDWRDSLLIAVRYLSSDPVQQIVTDLKGVKFVFECRFQLRAHARLQSPIDLSLDFLSNTCRRKAVCTGGSLQALLSKYEKPLEKVQRARLEHGHKEDTSTFSQLLDLHDDFSVIGPRNAEQRELATIELATVFSDVDTVNKTVWNYRSPVGNRNALAEACRRGCVDVVAKMLQAVHRKKICRLLHETDNEGLTILAHAAGFVECNRCDEIPKIVMGEVETFLPLIESDVSAEMVTMILEFDKTYNDGQIDVVLSLPLAAERGASYSTIKALLNAKADIDDRDRGCSALWLASRHGRTHLVEILAHRNADVDLIDTHERTPLHIAAAYGHIKVVQCLLKHRVVIDWADENGCTALARAAGRGYYDIVKLLLEAREFDPRIAARNHSKGQRPYGDILALVRAIDRGHYNIVKLLLENFCLLPIPGTWIDFYRCQRGLQKLYHNIRTVSSQSIDKQAGTKQLNRENVESVSNCNGLNSMPSTIFDFLGICSRCQRDDPQMLSIFLDKLQVSATEDILAIAGITLQHLLNGEVVVIESDGQEKNVCYNGHGFLPLMDAAQQGHVGIVKELLRRKADPAVTVKVMSPMKHKEEKEMVLMTNVESGRSEADLYHQDTALEVAARSHAVGSVECHQILETHLNILKREVEVKEDTAEDAKIQTTQSVEKNASEEKKTEQALLPTEDEKLATQQQNDKNTYSYESKVSESENNLETKYDPDKKSDKMFENKFGHSEAKSDAESKCENN